MRLIDAVRKIHSLGADQTLYVAQPWTPNSDVLVAAEPEFGGLPPEAERLGLRYFLEVSIAREVLEGWLNNMGSDPGLEQQCIRLIQYAVSDA